MVAEKTKKKRAKPGTLHQWIQDNGLMLKSVARIIGIDAAKSCGYAKFRIVPSVVYLVEKSRINQAHIGPVEAAMRNLANEKGVVGTTLFCIEDVPMLAGYSLKNRAFTWHVMAQYFGFESVFIHNGTWKSKMLGKKRGDSKNQKRLSLEIAKETFGCNFETDDVSDATLIGQYCADEIAIASTGKPLEARCLMV